MDTFAPPVLTWCESLAAVLRQHQLMLATAESCTGGLIAAACTSLSGSSTWFERGFITYSNAAKVAQLGVPETLIAAHGAVSEPVARAMASGALAHSQAQVSVAVTGVAGPTGGSVNKPVGTVWLAWATPQGVSAQQHCFAGSRQAVRTAAVEHALQGLLHCLAQLDHPFTP